MHPSRNVLYKNVYVYFSKIQSYDSYCYQEDFMIKCDDNISKQLEIKKVKGSMGNEQFVKGNHEAFM